MLFPSVPNFESPPIPPMIHFVQRSMQIDDGAVIANGYVSGTHERPRFDTGNGMYPPPKPPNDPANDDDGTIDLNGGSGPIFSIITAVYEKVMAHLGRWDGREDGGILFGPNGSSIVTFYCPDEGGERRQSSFRLNHRRANRIIKWCKRFDLQVLAAIHAHPPNIVHLSGPDLMYGRNLFANQKNDAAQFFMPLVVDGRLIPYLLRRDEPNSAIEARLQLIG